jgi:hypothetical protein
MGREERFTGPVVLELLRSQALSPIGLTMNRVPELMDHRLCGALVHSV